MIRFIFGENGSGKTTLITDSIRRDLSDGKKVLLLVPEQSGVETEMRLCRALLGVPTASLEILNFKRLPNAVFRKYGGLAYHYVNHGAKRLLMSMTLSALCGQLSYFSASDPFEKTAVDKALLAMEECIRHQLTPQVLDAAGKALFDEPEEKRLADKLRDLSLIRTVYTGLLGKRFRDPSDDPAFMNRLLCDHAYFAQFCVYLDGFYSLTPEQYETVRHIFAQSRAVTVSFACPMKQDPADLVRIGLYRHIRRMRELCNGKETESISLSPPKKTEESSLHYLARAVWSYQPIAVAPPAQDDTVRLFCCDNALSQAEAIAADICARLRAGYRCREIAVLCRNTEAQSGILDAVFSKYEIPYFFSRGTRLASKPLLRFVTGLFTLHRYGMRDADVIDLLKTGFTDLTADEIALFESYLDVWRLGGDDFSRDRTWKMHPLGYIESFAEKDRETLARVNAIKNSFLAQYERFFDLTAGAKTVSDYARALYFALLDFSVAPKLEQLALNEAALGDSVRAQEERQSFSALCDALDTLVEVCGDSEADDALFLRLLDLVLADVTLGRTPAHLDEVLIGDAQLLRPQNCRLIYLIDANEGVFPAAVEDGGAFTDAEKVTLETVCHAKFENSEYRIANEQFYFCDSICAAREALVISYCAKDMLGGALQRSMTVERICSLLPELCARDPQKTNDPLALLEGRRAGFELAVLYRNTAFGKALLSYYENSEGYGELLGACTIPITKKRMQLSARLANRLFAKDLTMSQSRIERFALCHFSYYCNDILKLRPIEAANFSAVDTGNFTHAVLERFMRYYASLPPGQKPGEDEISSRISAYTDDYFLNLCAQRPVDFSDKRLAHMIAKLKKNSVLLAQNLTDEFSQSAFRPRDFELAIGADGIKPLAIPLGDGACARFVGTIDRVDTYEADGKVYVRVVDYKTGKKEFRQDYLRLGLDLQMLLYLFSIWENGKERYGGEIVPAGVLYLGAGTPSIAAPVPKNEAEKKELLQRQIRRSGILCDNASVLRAMEPALDGKFIPVSCNKDGSFSKSSPVESIEQFGQLRAQITDTLQTICNELRGGNADAIPIYAKQKDSQRLALKETHNPCAFCKFKPLCRTYQ